MTRRRIARLAERTSDVTRFRGVAIAAVCAALAAAIAAVALTSPAQRGGSPGPLARPHVEAKVACASCHGEERMVDACTGCHGAHPSTREGHAGVACSTCHAAHGGDVVTFLVDGRAFRGDREVAAGAFRPAKTIAVPLPSYGSCAGCHAAGAIPQCVLDGQEALGDARPTVCFDEHRNFRAASGALTPRAAAWEAARQVAAGAPRAPAGASRGAGPWSWLGIAALVGLVAWGGVRRLDRRRVAHAAPAPAPAPPGVRRLPVIDAATCIGCHACVDACPYDVLEIRHYIAAVARPTDCCGLTLCEQKCPNGSLVMREDGSAPPPAVALDEHLESREVPGVFLAGDVTGQGLIRTATEHGARVAAAIAKRPRAPSDRLDLVIVGAGPAGLTAALEAQALGLRALALEQATVADSIRSFPRGKLVVDGDAEITKEELLARYLRTIREKRPPIEEGVRVESIERLAEGFAVHTATGATHRAAHVLLAVGRRGSPRRLGVDTSAFADHVHYALADARSFAGRRCVVVGLGDVAMETAIALSRQPDSEVTVVYRGDDFRRGRARNIAEMRRRRIPIRWRSEVTAVARGRVTLSSPGGGAELACDSLFVLIGSDVPVHRPFPIPIR